MTLDSPADLPSFPACDRCYSKKLKCDRKRPCGGCLKLGVECSRSAGLKRHPRAHAADSAPRKRKTVSVSGAAAHTAPISSEPDSKSPAVLSRTGTASEDDVVKPPGYSDDSSLLQSTADAQDLLRQELMARQGAVQAAGSKTLKDALKSIDEILVAVKSTPGAKEPEAITFPPDFHLDSTCIPSAELVQWIVTKTLHRDRTEDSVFDFLAVVQPRSFAKMADQILRADPNDPENTASLVCVNTVASFFVTFYATTDYTSDAIESSLLCTAQRLMSAAQAKVMRLSSLRSCDLPTLQALILGSFNAQEQGQPLLCWRLSSTASQMCLALDLHKNKNPYTTAGDRDLEYEARACFACCYIMDKGLAMNLCKPPLLVDSSLEAHITQPSDESAPDPGWDVGHVLLELARVQSVIVSELQSVQGRAKPAREKNAIVRRLELQMSDLWRTMTSLRDRESHTMIIDQWINWSVLDFSFHTVMTSIFRYAVQDGSDNAITEKCVTSAREAVRVLKRLGVGNAGTRSERLRNISFMHWTLFFYPFTNFFVIFCHYIQTGDGQDLELMRSMVVMLETISADGDAWNGGPLILKLKTLCTKFYELAAKVPYATPVYHETPGSLVSSAGTPASAASAAFGQNNPKDASVAREEGAMYGRPVKQQSTVPPGAGLYGGAGQTPPALDSFLTDSDPMWQLLSLDPSLDLLNTDWSF